MWTEGKCTCLRVARPLPAAGAEGAVVVTEPADPEPGPEAAAAVDALATGADAGAQVEAARLLRVSVSLSWRPWRPRLGREVQRSGDEDELPPELGRFLLLFRLLLQNQIKMRQGGKSSWIKIPQS